MGWKPFFIWQGIHSRDMAVEVLGLPPFIRAEEHIKFIDIPGKSGKLYYRDNTFEQIELGIDIAVNSISRIDPISSWLTGSGELVLSNMPNKQYKAVIVNRLPLEQVMRQIYRGTVHFSCQPYKYSLHPWQDQFVLNSPAKFFGKGTVNSKPVITVYGSGDIVLDINSTVFSLTGVEGHITINSEIMDAYKGTQNQNSKMNGGFPILLPEGRENWIHWQGNGERVEIQPNWAWI